MSKYGYIACTFSMHSSRKKELLPLGDLPGGTDALTLIYGALRGLSNVSVHNRNRHLRIDSLAPQGRTVRFTSAVGQSGISSDLLDPDEGDNVVFKRTDRHIESSNLRGLIVAPTVSQRGILILEVQGRASAKHILIPALKRSIRNHVGLIVNFEAVADGAALEQFLQQAAIRGITLKRSGLPADIADAVDLAQNDKNVGRLELRIIPSGIKSFTRQLVDRIRNDAARQQSLLRVGGFEFSDLDITMEVGERRRTLNISADRVPTFTYNLPGGAQLSDDAFFKEAMASVDEIAQAVGVTVGGGWQTGAWSEEALATVVDVPAEAVDDEHDEATAQ